MRFFYIDYHYEKSSIRNVILNVQVSFMLEKLAFQSFTKDDGGQYKVTAKNDAGEGNANITINLEG